MLFYTHSPSGVSLFYSSEPISLNSDGGCKTQRDVLTRLARFEHLLQRQYFHINEARGKSFWFETGI